MTSEKQQDLEKELHILELSFLKAAKDKDPKQEEFWRKYQHTKNKYIEALENE